jgi:ribosomal protein S18 acetylase RimI-like enzyme
MGKEIADIDLFMMCHSLNPDALTEIPKEYHIRTCRRNELDIWKAIHFDDPMSANKYRVFMTKFFNEVYAERESLFFQKCLFVCDSNDTPIATCFGWKAYETISTIHWFKVLKTFEGLGIGRALLSIVMKSFAESDYPIYLHTQPSSFRAIKLYSDFGFAFVTDEVIGYRRNGLDESLPFLKTHMYPKDYERLQFTKAPEHFLKAVTSSAINQF